MKQTISLITVILILFFSSCASIIVRDIELDKTQPFTHNIETLMVTNSSYTIKNKDTTKFETVITQHFDKKNKLIKQIDYYKNNKTHTTYFNYNSKNLLVTKTSKNQDSIDILRYEYFYDKKNRVIESKSYYKNESWAQKLTQYDSKGNRIMERLNSSKPNSNDWISLFEYNYKKRFYTVKTLDTNYVEKYKSRYITYFNKKGYLVKTEHFAEDEQKILMSFITSEYDESGNLTSKKSFDKDGKMKSENYYINKYDSFGNIIQRDRYYENRIVETSKFEIKYRE